MSYLNKFANRIGMAGGKEKRRRVDESTSNSSLSNLRYVITEKPKWKVFRKQKIVPIPAYQTSLKPRKGCPCGSDGPCKQKVTPKGVTIHYPQKKFQITAMHLLLKDPVKFGHKVVKSCQKLVKTTKKTFSTFPSKKSPLPKPGERGFYNSNPKGGVKTIRPKKFPIFRLDKISYRPLGPKIITPKPYTPFKE